MIDTETCSGKFSSHSEPSCGFTSTFLDRIRKCTSCSGHNNNRTHANLTNGARPRRLANPENMCYFNATIQALAHCGLVTNWVHQHPTENMLFETYNGETLLGWRILCFLEDLSGVSRTPPGVKDRSKDILYNRKKHRRRRKKYAFSSENSSGKRSRYSGNGTFATEEASNSMREEYVSSLLRGTGQQDSHEF